VLKIKTNSNFHIMYRENANLVVEEAGIPGENHRPWANNW
jgi:hypothetical protein